MPSIIVEIEWNVPDDPHWLNADNVSLALHAYCANTQFNVSKPKEIIISKGRHSFLYYLFGYWNIKLRNLVRRLQ